MTYSLFDRKAYIAPVATVTGYSDLIKFVCARRAAGPLRRFVDEGQTEDMKKVISEIDDILPYASDITIKHTLEGLKEGLGKVERIAVISG